MSVYRTEIASDKIPSDNPVHQRLLKAYYAAQPYIKGDLLELGCGEGRGVELLAPLADGYTGMDKIQPVIDCLRSKYPEHHFQSGAFPPFPFKDVSFDTLLAFQVIEHVKEDEAFVAEIQRVLKPGGRALLSTPNIKMTLSRNPWHIREYTAEELTALCERHFPTVEMKGIAGNEKVMEYHRRNKQSVDTIMRFDFFDLQHKLPAPLLRVPYEILNRLNRDRLKKTDDERVNSVTHKDYFVKETNEQNLDLFCLMTKQ